MHHLILMLHAAALLLWAWKKIMILGFCKSHSFARLCFRDGLKNWHIFWLEKVPKVSKIGKPSYEFLRLTTLS